MPGTDAFLTINLTLVILRMPTENELLLSKIGNGALAGIVGVGASFPLDLIKVISTEW